MDFKGLYEKKRIMINNYLDDIIKVENAPDVIVSAMKYSLFAGGKRIRPVLSLSVCEGLGGNPERVLPLACCIELIHTYSLIHDDLPSMDNDDMRRGKPTNHKVYGEAIAVLAGDALLNYAYEFILKTISDNNFESKYTLAGQIIGKAAGSTGMIGGQVIDIQNEGKNMSLEELIHMHSKKTGALIEAACAIGGIVADKMDKLDDIKDYSHNLGIAFQIVDDILDCTGDANKLGKKTGRDEARGKSTFVKILGVNESRKLAIEYSNRALNLANMIDKTGFLGEFTEFLLNREN
ncbi:MAG: polyprenyl synthetase family protein [Clostridiales bacterium]|nr:polyprenyl synthetase family protein [Clostridiales bacterium]